uniref:Mastermind like domain containing 1 n=1 Tax=Ursus americanus TaxID=9643 RepID=A0A452RLC8_URSAM
MDDWKSRLVIKSMVPHFAMVGNRQEPRKLQESVRQWAIGGRGNSSFPCRSSPGRKSQRQEGDNFQFPGMGDGGYPNKIKRPCLEDVTLSMGPATHPSTSCAELQVPPLTMNPSPAAVGVAGHPLPLETNPMNGSVMGSPFVVPPAGEVGVKEPTVPYYDKANSVPAVDQELQDLLEELTKIQEPSPNELDLEKILGSKPDEPLVLEHPQVSLSTTPKPPVQMPHLESLGASKDFASSCSQHPGASLQVPPSPAGISYVIPPTSKPVASPSPSAAQAKGQVQGALSVPLPPLPGPQWHHAHQLKVLAASKQGSATRQPGTTPSWSGLPPPGVSPSYRPVPSPHPPPQFSSQSLMVSCMASSNVPASTFQASPNALLASMASGGSAAAVGPAMLYTPEKLPSPALSQPPPFSPQSSILANLVSSSVKSPPGHLLSALPSSNPGPSPPYRPEKLSSPGLPQQSFTPQCSTPQCSLIRSLTPSGNPLTQPPPPQQSASTIFKPMTTNSPKTLSMIMQQGLASPGQGVPEPFNFGNTKPLSHFVSEPGPQKMPSMPATSRQPSLFHYLQQPPASSATASTTATATLQQQQQPDPSSFLLQQIMQQPQRFQRSVAPDSLPSLPRQVRRSHVWSRSLHQHQRWNPHPSGQGAQPGDPSPSNTTHVDKACKLGEARPPQVSLGRQPPSCQALGSESFLPSSSFAHELARVTSSYSTSEAAPWGGWDPKAWRQVPAPLLPSCDAPFLRSFGSWAPLRGSEGL